jgi:hypothetical protein
MKLKGLDGLVNSEGKGILGCMTAIVLLGLAIFLGIKLGPIYYSNFTFEADLKTEVSRAGSRFIDNDSIVKDVLDLAKKNEVHVTKEGIRIERFAGQVHITVQYSVPVDFAVLERDINFQIKVSSFTAT